MRNVSLALLAAVALIPATAWAQPAKPAGQCFFTRDWNGWRAADNNAMYIRVQQSRIFRVDFAGGCPGLTSPATHLITKSTTGDVCTALDLDVKVSDDHGFSTSCIVDKITPLTKAQASALPKNLIP
jgi:hypothetical protein